MCSNVYIYVIYVDIYIVKVTNLDINMYTMGI